MHEIIQMNKSCASLKYALESFAFQFKHFPRKNENRENK